jgi:hypothetical protein
MTLMTVQFIANADVYLEFFERIKDLPEDTEETRIHLLCQMAKEGKKISIIQTSRTREQIIEDYRKHGDVLYFKVNGGDKDEIKKD